MRNINMLLSAICVVGPVAAPIAVADTIHVDLRLAASCPGNYSVTRRDCSGADGKAYPTIQQAVDSVVAGDTVLVHSGDYTGEKAPANIVITQSGTADKPIVFRAVPRRSVSTHTFTLKGDYITIEGLHITQKAMGDFHGVFIVGDHNRIIDNYFFEVAGKGTIISYWSTTVEDRASHAYVARNHLYRCQMGIVAQGDNWLVEHNDVERLVLTCPHFEVHLEG